MRISERAQKSPASGIRFMFELAKKYDNVINLCIGEPDFPTPGNIIEAGEKALSQGHTKYTSNAGVLELRKTLAEKLERENGIIVDPEKNIIVTTGAVEAIGLALLTVINPGDEVLFHTPSWPNYWGQILMAGGIPVPIATHEKDKFHVSPKALEAAITIKTKLIIINSPTNPTGAVLSKAEMIDIAKVVKKHNLLLLSDEPYEKIIYDGLEHVSFGALPGMEHHVITVNSLSKTYAMTGWRVGYAVASEDIIGYMTKLQENVCSCVNAAAQQASIEAINGDQSHSLKMVTEYNRRRDMLVEGLNSIEGISCILPEGAFYAFVNVKGLGGTSAEIARSILEGVQVATTPGSAFGEGGEGYLRISYASSYEVLEEAVQRIKKYVETRT